jgi:excisionase family DNA binding protein
MTLLSKDFENALRISIQSILKEEFSSFISSIDPPEPSDQTSIFLTRKKAAEKANISISTLNNLVKKGKIKTNRLGSKILIKADDLFSAITPVSA